jgi:hypothetical protein
MLNLCFILTVITQREEELLWRLGYSTFTWTGCEGPYNPVPPYKSAENVSSLLLELQVQGSLLAQYNLLFDVVIDNFAVQTIVNSSVALLSPSMGKFK